MRNTKSEARNSKQMQNAKFKMQNKHLISQYPSFLISFFALLGLLGAFLSKGVNPPFGEVNQWLFQYFPGMSMFRDPTKFYLMVALSYSILIPFSMHAISNLSISNLHFKFKIYNVFLLFTICYLLFLIRPAWMGELTGTFKPQTVPKEYIELKDFIVSQPEFFRTLWIPTQSRFRIQTENHPLINADVLFKTSSPSAIVRKLDEDETRHLLEKLSIKYIIIPYDAAGEIFLEDRKYNESKRVAFEEAIDTVPYLKKVEVGAITVYETPRHSDHFWLIDDGIISYKRLTSTEYEVTLSSQRATTLVFSEQFHPHWKATVANTSIGSKPTEDGFNSFAIPQGEYLVRVYFEPQQHAKYTYLFSFAFLVMLLVYLVKSRSSL